MVSALREIAGVLNTLVRRVESAENELKVVKQKIATSTSSLNESSASVSKISIPLIVQVRVTYCLLVALIHLN